MLNFLKPLLQKVRTYKIAKLTKKFTNHIVPKDTLDYRQKLSQQWNDDKIYDCTPEAGFLVLQYKMLARLSVKDYSHAGKSLFCWDMQNKEILYFIVQENEEKTHRFDIKILPDGKLSLPTFSDRYFESPQDFLDSWTLKLHIVHKRVEIPPESSLGHVLSHTFNEQCSIYFPPDYPPMLIQIALSNHDYLQAVKILKHPLVDDPNLGRTENRRLGHVLETIIPTVIKGKHIRFLDYLILEYDLQNQSLENPNQPLINAIKLGADDIAQHVLHLYPKGSYKAAFETALLESAKKGKSTFFQWLLNNIPSHLTLSNEHKTLLLNNVMLRFGVNQFRETVTKLHIDIPWQELIIELSKSFMNPRIYLGEFLKIGHSIESLDGKVKVSIILQALNSQDPVDVLQQLLLDFPELKPELGNALNEVILDETKIKILIGFGVVPTEGNLESLLKSCEIGPRRSRLFLTLLDGIQDLSQAKANLKITSSFGKEALEAVLTKFPDLKQDLGFLMGMLNSTWKGTEIAAKKLVEHAITPGKLWPQPLNKEFAPPPEEIYQLPAGGKNVVTDFLVDVLLSAKQYGKIKEALIKRPDFITEFWWKCIFAGISSTEDVEWEELAQATLPLIEEKDRLHLIRNSVKFSQAPLAALFMKHSEKLLPQNCIELFWFSLECRDPQIAQIFIDNGYTNTYNKNGTTYLHICASENCPEFISLLLANGADPDLKDINSHTPYNVAIKNYCISTARLLKGEQAFSDISSFLIKMDMIPLEQWLLVAFLNSSGKDILDLITVLRGKEAEIGEMKKDEFRSILAKVEHFIRCQGTLIVRFPRKETQKEIHAIYKSAVTNYENYEEQQISWGNRCEELYLELLRESKQKNFVLLEVLMRFAEPRSQEKGYESWRMAYPIQGIGLVTALGGRYFYFWGLAQKIYKALLKTPDWHGKELQLTKEGYRVFHQFPNGLLVPLTTLYVRKPFSKRQFIAKFIHTGVNELKIHLPYMSHLYEEIKKYRNDDPENLSSELKKKIAFFFWLGCHLTVTARGSSQYMVMLHRLLYNMHGFQPSPWGQYYVQPDCVALMVPFQLFYDEYYDNLFEFPPTKSLSINQ